MFQFVTTETGIDLIEVTEPNASGDVETFSLARNLTLDDLAEITIAAVTVVNPPLGQMMRNMLTQGSDNDGTEG